MKILHLPHAVGGNAWGVSRGERELGYQSDVLVGNQPSFGYPADVFLELEKTSSQIVKTLKLFNAFVKYRKQYDVFHFNFGSSLIHSPRHFLNQFDLPFYPKDAKLFVTYQGCDIRQKFPTMKRTMIAACHNPQCYGGQCNSGQLDEYRRQGINKMAPYVEHIWAVNPDLLYFLPKEKSSFLPYAVVTGKEEVSLPNFHGPTFTIVHAPTNRAGKGSDFVLAAFDRLKIIYGNRVEFKLVEGMTHAEALKVYRSADVVVDQLLVGWYGAVAVESMRMGKPVIARIAQEDLHFLPEGMAHDVLDAVIQAGPDTIYDVLVRCIEDRNFCKQKSEASLEYVRKWHDLKYIASLTSEKYESANSAARVHADQSTHPS